MTSLAFTTRTIEYVTVMESKESGILVTGSSIHTPGRIIIFVDEDVVKRNGRGHLMVQKPHTRINLAPFAGSKNLGRLVYHGTTGFEFVMGMLDLDSRVSEVHPDTDTVDELYAFGKIHMPEAERSMGQRSVVFDTWGNCGPDLHSLFWRNSPRNFTEEYSRSRARHDAALQAAAE